MEIFRSSLFTIYVVQFIIASSSINVHSVFREHFNAPSYISKKAEGGGKIIVIS